MTQWTEDLHLLSRLATFAKLRKTSRPASQRMLGHREPSLMFMRHRQSATLPQEEQQWQCRLARYEAR